MNARFEDYDLDQWLTHIQQQHWRTMDLTLDRISKVWENLNGECASFVIAVAGTNGKGSSISMLDSVYRQSGKTTGVYTSPHLVRFNERIRVNGIEATDVEIGNTFCRIEVARDGIGLTYFEYGTLCALLIFQKHAVDVVLLEVGLGGRLDAVNMVHNDIALITSIGIDHEAWLGSDRAQIAAEKAGIIKDNGRVVCSDSDIPDSLFKVVAQKNATLVAANRDYHLDPHADQAGGQFTWQSAHPLVPEQWRELSGLIPPLPGEHQAINLGGVIAVLALSSAEMGISPVDLQAKLAKTSLLARCQIISQSPLVIVDVAHNQDSAQELARFLAGQPREGRSIAVFGALKDKALDHIALPLRTCFDSWVLAGLGGERGQTARELAAKLKACIGDVPLNPCDSPVEAYQAALDQAGEDDRIVIFGSFYTVGDIIGFIESTGGIELSQHGRDNV